MQRFFTLLLIVLLAAIFGLFSSGPAVSQQRRAANKPTLKPVAETRLLMEGLAHPNFLGLERILKQKPASVQQWKFARGQALLLAETGNLLMLRPPKQAGREAWFERAMKLRAAGVELARAAGQKDFVTSRRLLVQVANRCNSCHNIFRVRKEIVPFAKKQ